MTEIDKFASERGWIREDGLTMPAHSRIRDGVRQVIVLRPDRSGWRLFVGRSPNEAMSGTFRECAAAADKQFPILV